MRTCKKCKEEKPLEEFRFTNKARGTRRYECKQCQYNREQEHKAKNRASYRKTVREWQKKKSISDKKFAMQRRLRGLINTCIYRQGYTKKSKTQDILGCSYEEFTEYIESKFVDGMNWDNRSEWHIDHIKPISLANTEEEAIALNHYTNLQPLWAVDNFKKSNKWHKN